MEHNFLDTVEQRHANCSTVIMTGNFCKPNQKTCKKEENNNGTVRTIIPKKEKKGIRRNMTLRKGKKSISRNIRKEKKMSKHHLK